MIKIVLYFFSQALQPDTEFHSKNQGKRDSPASWEDKCDVNELAAIAPSISFKSVSVSKNIFVTDIWNWEMKKISQTIK